jgi:hypothetical protein
MIVWSRMVVDVRIQIPNESIARCLGFGRYKSSDGWVPAGAVLRRCSCRGHHVDTTILDWRVQVDAAPNLRVFFGGIPIRRRSEEEELIVPTKGWKMGVPIGSPCDVMAKR